VAPIPSKDGIAHLKEFALSIAAFRGGGTDSPEDGIAHLKEFALPIACGCLALTRQLRNRRLRLRGAPVTISIHF